MTRPFPHLEEKKKRSSLFVIAALIWPLSTTLKTLTLSWCYHSKLSQILFGDLEVQTVPDKKKNVIDVIKDGKNTFSRSSTETWCDTLNLKNQKAQVWYFLQILSCIYKYCLFPGVSYAVDKNASMWISLWKKQSKGKRQITWEKGRKKKTSPRTERQQKWLVTTSYHSSQQNKETELTTVDSQNELNMFQFKTFK